MGGFAKDMIQGEHARIAGLCLKKSTSSVLCNACYFEADDEDKKIYVKATEKEL
jgi:hypothetical protein